MCSQSCLPQARCSPNPLVVPEPLHAMQFCVTFIVRLHSGRNPEVKQDYSHWINPVKTPLKAEPLSK